ncbi:MAG: carboxypeptidase-like regulatory domain-containing protein, partial [Gammaproteobacteria bacterium]
SLEPSSESVDLRGWVGNELGVGLEGAWVGLTSDDAAEAAQTYRTVYTDEHGDFVFEGIIAGENYKLSVNLNPDYPYYEEPGFVVSQTPGPVEIVLPRLHYADFDGMILDRELRPVPGYEIYISNLSTGYHVRKIVSDSSGFFRLEHFPVGEVSLTTQGREHLKATGLTLSDDAYRNLEIVIDRGDLYLSGWVNDRGGTSVENALITLQRSYRRGAVEYRSYRSRTTGNNGRFAFTGLGGGEYQVSVFATGYRQLVFSHRLETQADEINVTLQKEEAGDS